MARTIDECAGWADDWQQLADESGSASTCHPWWALTWLRHHAACKPFVVAASENDHLLALAPLHERRAGPVRVSRFIGHGLGAVGEILTAADDPRGAAAIAEWLARDGRRITQLTNLKVGAGGHQELRTAYGPTCEISGGDRCPTIVVPDDLDTMLAVRSKRLRKNLRRGRRRLAEQHSAYEMETVTDLDRLHEVLPEVMVIYDASEAEKPRHHLLRGPEETFTQDLLETAATAGRLRLYLARVDGRPVSFDVGFTGRGRLELWLGRFDPSDAALSPGHLSLEHILRTDEARSLGTVDLGLGDDDYKLLWTDDGVETTDLLGARGRWRQRAARTVVERAAHRRD